MAAGDRCVEEEEAVEGAQLPKALGDRSTPHHCLLGTQAERLHASWASPLC